jgi:alanyl-tRNA synthetase
VLRRIMRRAMRHAHKLGAEDPLLWRLVAPLEHAMGQAFPELGRAQALITETLQLEEERFRKTLDRGLKLLDEATERLGDGEPLSGAVAFKLYDTYGFPLDLTQDILRGQGRSVDLAGFDAAMAAQRETARKAWAGSGEAATEALWFDLRDRLGATEFLGYDTEAAEGQIQAILVDGVEAEAAEAGTDVMVLVNQTPFYGESGGQMGDSGIVFAADGTELAVRDTQKKLGTLRVHVGTVTKGRLHVGQAVELRVDGTRRRGLRAHHSATHLLHEALRRRLGEHVTQKGSLVAPDRLRFDFSHPRPLSAEDVRVVEHMVNERIRANAAVRTRFMTPDEAVAEGALALFGEKYGEEVRVVSMGGEDPEKGPGRAFSTELCGGTHVARTGDIGLFKVVGEQALAAGVRRVEAVVADAAFAYLTGREALLNEAATALKAAPADVPARVASLIEERRRLERELAETRRKLAAGGATGLEVEEVAGIKFVRRLLQDVPARELKGMADELKAQVGSGVVALVSAANGKGSVVVGVTESLSSEIDAVTLVRVASEKLGGKGGGGRAEMAQAGGPDGDKANDALEAVKQAIAESRKGVAA